MSQRYPIVAVTGSSGAGTTTTREAFERIFVREGIHAAIVEGDSFHRYNRVEMEQQLTKAEQEGKTLSHFGPKANCWDKLETLFKSYGETGTGQIRRYLHNFEEAIPLKQQPGTFTSWQEMPEHTDLLFYEGLHGGVVTESIDAAQYVDLLIGLTPIVNLEWIQKIHRDVNTRGYSPEAIAHTIIHRMPDYVHYITPQFSRTHVNFQRVPTVDTSNPFVWSEIPPADESFVVIRFRDPKGIDFPYFLQMIDGAFMSKPNTIVVPGGKMGFAMELMLTPMVHQLLEDRNWF
ncbi:phosphoribulokinase [Pelagibaculum spongiae]|uniref:Phosphoribulokinase n=1 Tax=Pelagibaculum spongiae TaxID=2080658 RepID=A0A2V1GX52_9GAMM|nr:phosphoribulokinase [Pelagibaculum spongiae]PVZ66265.1 phosphoribulokinase [Pelagibaculum spongiae]